MLNWSVDTCYFETHCRIWDKTHKVSICVVEYLVSYVFFLVVLIYVMLECCS